MKKLLILVAVMCGAMAVPLIALLALAGVAATALTCTPGVGGPLSSSAPVPGAARVWVSITHAACPALPAPFIAAVMAQESGFRPDAYADDENGGTWGLFQVNASIWQSAYGAPWSADLNTNGVWDVKDPEIHAAAAGKYLCARLDVVRQIRAAQPDWASTRDLSELEALVIAHNAGESRLQTYPAIPSITAQFILSVRQRMSAWSAAGFLGSPQAVPLLGEARGLPVADVGVGDPACALNGLAPHARAHAQRLLGHVPGLRVTSTLRSPEHNREVGGVPGSFHLVGRAVDFAGSPQALAAGRDFALQDRAEPGCPGPAEILIHDTGSGEHLHVAW